MGLGWILLMFEDIGLALGIERGRGGGWLKVTSHPHLENGLAWTTAKQCDLAAVLKSDAMGERETEARALLLALTNERCEKAITDVFRDAVSVVAEA